MSVDCTYDGGACIMIRENILIFCDDCIVVWKKKKINYNSKKKTILSTEVSGICLVSQTLVKPYQIFEKWNSFVCLQTEFF